MNIQLVRKKNLLFCTILHPEGKKKTAMRSNGIATDFVLLPKSHLKCCSMTKIYGHAEIFNHISKSDLYFCQLSARPFGSLVDTSCRF
jgi:hypothetical protein